MSITNANKLLAVEERGDVATPVSADDMLQRGKHYITAFCAEDAAADTDIERILFCVTPNSSGGILLYGAWIVPDGDVTADGTDFASLQLGYRPTAGGGSQTVIGDPLTTETDDWVALSKVSLYDNPAGVAVAQNKNITLDRSHGGAGVVLPNMRVVLEFALV